MNDPALATGASDPDQPADEPRSWRRSLWHWLHNLLRPPADAEALREVVEELIEDAPADSGISQAERVLLANVMGLRERKAVDCMVPRADIIAADISSTLKDVLDLMAAHAHSRIPIYRGTLDDIIGMVHMKDIIPCIAHQQARTVSDLLRPVMFVAPSMPASKLLLQMRHTRQHMAFVIDEFGGVDGVVTIEDLVEQIVGEIEDEHDTPAAAPIITRADGTLLVDARLPIEDFAAHTGINLAHSPDYEDVDTLGGYVAHLAGRVPHIGETFPNGHGLDFEVLEMEQSRIARLRVKGLRRAEPEIPEAKTRARA